MIPPVSTQVYIDTDRGTIQIELAVLDAPLTVENFITLARRGFFNGLTVHRVVPNFVVQSGDPRGDGEGGPGLHDPRRAERACRICAAPSAWRSTGPTPAAASSSSPTRRSRTSTRKYTVFGRVIAGMEVVDAIQQRDVIKQVRVWDGKTPP